MSIRLFNMMINCWIRWIPEGHPLDKAPSTRPRPLHPFAQFGVHKCAEGLVQLGILDDFGWFDRPKMLAFCLFEIFPRMV